MGICIIVATAGYMIHCLFGSFISNEWGYWIVPLLIRYAELYKVPAEVGVPAQVEEPSDVSQVSQPAAAAAHYRSL